mgnify:CR=1 FL=1|tara:strand:- start:1907 stop:3295 length:1389 start_codon:yes stop_codon:yes gene_type:complete
MANVIRIKKRSASGSAGAPSSLAPSELAFNENSGDLKLYYGLGDDGQGEATSIITVGGSGAFFSKTDTRSANAVLAGPTTGSDANPTFRALVAADIPSIAHTKISDFDTGVRTNRLDQMSAPTGNVDINSNKLTNVTDPTSAQDAATKAYVDAVKTGLDVKDSVKVATTANITLSGTQTIDGVAVSADERVLVKNQSTASENGIYDCKSGTWARSSDFDANSEVTSGAFVFVEQGTVSADSGFVLTTDGSITVGSTSLSFTQFSGAGQITAGNGLQKSGNTLSADLKANGGVVIESGELAVKLDATSITGTLAVSDGGTGATSASAARTALGVAIGSDVQAYDAQLDTFAGASSATATALVALTSTEVAILDGATVTTAELNILDGVTSTASELNILDGATVTTTELNIIDGGTSATSTTLAAADRMVINDAGTMKQVALSDLVTFIANGTASSFVVDGGTY